MFDLGHAVNYSGYPKESSHRPLLESQTEA